MTEIAVQPTTVVVESHTSPVAVAAPQQMQAVLTPGGVEVVVAAQQVVAAVVAIPAVDVTTGAVAVTAVGQGVPGPKGEPGAGGSYLVWDQQAAAAVWSITHALNKRPSVAVVDTTDRLLLAQIDYVDDTQLLITFGRAVSGKAYLT